MYRRTNQKYLWKFVLIAVLLCVPSTVDAKKHPPGKLTGVDVSADKHYKNGRELLKIGQKYSAACSMLDALDVESKTKILKSLAPLVAEAYEEKERLAKGYLDQGNYHEARTHYQHLQAFLESVRNHNLLNFPVINVGKAIVDASAGMSEEEYQEAEKLRSQGDYLNAIEAYVRALDHTPGYKDSQDRIGESYYLEAEQQLAKREFRRGADYFVKAATESNYKDASSRAAEIYYELGRHFLDSGHYREAWDDFDRVLQLDRAYRDAASLQQHAFDGARVTVAFGDFVNKTGQNIGGIALGDFIFQQLRSKLHGSASRFLELTEDRTNADFVARGAINQAAVNFRGPSSEKKAEYQQWTEYQTYKGSDGKQYQREIPRSANIGFVEHESSCEVIVAGNVTLNRRESGEIVLNHQIDHRASDSAHWADSVYPPALEQRLSYQIQKLVQAESSLRSEDEMIKEVVDKVTDDLTQAIIGALDTPGRSTDPDVLHIVAR